AQPAARRERLGHPVVASGEIRRRGQRVPVLEFGFLEQAGRPERIPVEGHRLGSLGIRLVELLRLGAGEAAATRRARCMTPPGTFGPTLTRIEPGTIEAQSDYAPSGGFREAKSCSASVVFDGDAVIHLVN